MKIEYIDVGNMSKKEAMKVIGIKYVPWYKDVFFWSLFVILTSPSFTILMITMGK